MQGCTFTGNSAGSKGGALDAGGSVRLSVSSSSFNNNSAHGIGGGALFAVGLTKPCDIRDASFTANAATASSAGDGSGGAIHILSSGLVSIRASRLVANHALRGGAISGVSNTLLGLANSSFVYNHASTEGGAVYLAGPPTTTTTTATTSRAASLPGVVQLRNCTFKSDFAGQLVQAATDGTAGGNATISGIPNRRLQLADAAASGFEGEAVATSSAALAAAAGGTIGGVGGSLSVDGGVSVLVMDSSVLGSHATVGAGIAVKSRCGPYYGASSAAQLAGQTPFADILQVRCAACTRHAYMHVYTYVQPCPLLFVLPFTVCNGDSFVWCVGTAANAFHLPCPAERARHVWTRAHAGGDRCGGAHRAGHRLLPCAAGEHHGAPSAYFWQHVACHVTGKVSQAGPRLCRHPPPR